MATIVLQVLVEIPEVNDGDPQAMEQDIQCLLKGESDVSPNFLMDKYGIANITVVFEDIV